MTILLLSLFAFAAGFIDAIAGGGGLIQLPAIFILLPNLIPGVLPSAILGTNKFSSSCGTLFAVHRYLRHLKVRWEIVIPTSICAAIFSFLGAACVRFISPQHFKLIVFLLLICVLVYVLIKKDFGMGTVDKNISRFRTFWYAVIIGIVMGFYDGIFGPGTGSILMFLLVGIFGLNFLSATMCSKIINLVTNLFALAWFATHGEVIYKVAVPMAACNILGSFFGTRLAIKRGSKSIRVFFLIAVVGILSRYLWDLAVK